MLTPPGPKHSQCSQSGVCKTQTTQYLSRLKYCKGFPLPWRSNAPPPRTDDGPSLTSDPWVSLQHFCPLSIFQRERFFPASEPSHMLFSGLECLPLHEAMPLHLAQVRLRPVPFSPRTLLFSLNPSPQAIAMFSVYLLHVCLLP